MQLPANPEVLTAELLSDLEVPHEVEISPSGKYVAYNLRSDWNKPYPRWASSIWLAETGKENSSRRLTGQKHDTFYYTPKFSPVNHNGHAVLAFLSDRGGDVGKFVGIDLLRVNEDDANGKVEVVPLTSGDTQEEISKFCWAPNGKSIAYLSPDEISPETKAKRDMGYDAKVYGEDLKLNRLRIIDVESGKVTTIVSKDIHIYDLAWSPDGQRIAYVVTRTPDMSSPRTEGGNIETVNVSNGTIDVQVKFPNMVNDLSWAGDVLWWRSVYDLSQVLGSICVYRRKVDQVYGYGYARCGSGETDTATNMGFSPALRTGPRGAVVQIQSKMSDLICQLPDWGQEYDPDDGVLYDSNEHDTRGWTIGERDGQTVVVVVSSTASSPQEVYSIIGDQKVCLSDHGKGIRALGEMVTSQTLHGTAEDGTPLDAVFTVPASSHFQKPSSGWPTIVYNHGGPEMQSAHGFDSAMHQLAPWFASMGCATLCPNYRGSSGRGSKFQSDILGAVGTKDYSDVIDLTRAAIAAGLVDEKRVGIGGWSYGGYLAYVAVTRDSTFHFAAAMCGAGGTDWDIGVMTSDTPVFAVALAGRAAWNTTKDDTWNRNGSPVWHMQDIHTPILILHGEDDDRVHLSHAMSFHHGCLARGLSCEMVVYPREGHGMIPPFERPHYLDMLERIKKFYGQHLGTAT